LNWGGGGCGGILGFPWRFWSPTWVLVCLGRESHTADFNVRRGKRRFGVLFDV
jgi:hypothetical protein